jgi:DNA adenine methylase
MRKPQSYAEIYNDLDTRVVSVFKVLRDPEQAKRLKELLELTPFSRSDFKEAFENSDDVVEQARRTIYRAFAAVGSDSAVNDRKTTGFRGVVLSRSPASNEWDTYRPCVDVFTERLRRVIIENREASWILDKHDSIETLFYVDPPYAMETRNEKNNYKFEMTNEDHEALLYQLVLIRLRWRGRLRAVSFKDLI